MSVEIKGIDEVMDGLNKRIGIDKVAANMKKACALVERAAKEKAPKGDGDLRRSISSKVEVEGEEVKGVVFSNLEYAPYVEYGTGLYREENPQAGYWVYVKGSEGSGNYSGKRYTLEEAKWIVARMKEEGLDAVYTQGRHPHPYLRPALYENRLNVIMKLQEGLLDTND